MSAKAANAKPETKQNAAGPDARSDAQVDRPGPNEGEGSQTGARQYDEATRAFVASGKVKKAAEEAARDISGPKADSLKQAEEAGKQHSHGEDPLLHR